MIGMMIRTPAGGVRQKSVVLETRALLHLRVAWASVARGPRTPEALVRRRVLTAKRLRKAGVTRLVVPEAFAYGEQLEKVGVAPVSTRLCGGRWRRIWHGRSWQGGTSPAAGTAGGGGRPALRRAGADRDGAGAGKPLRAAGCALRRRHPGQSAAAGVRRFPAVPTRQQMEEADVLVLFAARTDLRRRDPAVLRLYDEAAPLPPPLPPVLEGQMPPGLCRPQRWPYWWRAASCGRGRSPWARRRADTAENFAKPQAASLDILKSTHYNTTL